MLGYKANAWGHSMAIAHSMTHKQVGYFGNVSLLVDTDVYCTHESNKSGVYTTLLFQSMA